MIRTAVIGYGGMGSRHAALLKTVPGVEMRGACDILPSKREQIARDGLKCYASLEELCGDREIDLAVVATPNHLHREMSAALMRSGKHVVCEKPVALSTGELEEILQAQRETGKLFTVHQNRRWDEDYMAVCRLLREGTLGEVYNIESRVTGSRGVPNDWRRLPEFGGGMLMDWGVHLIDQALHMISGPVKEVYCRLSYVTGSPVDDGFLLLLTFENGVTYTMEASTWKFLSLPRWYVNGKKGSACMARWHTDGEIALLRDDASSADAKPVVTAAGITKTMAPREDDSVAYSVFPLAPSKPLAFYQNVVAAIRGKAEQYVKAEQVMRVMKLIEAARFSAAEGKPVQFE